MPWWGWLLIWLALGLLLLTVLVFFGWVLFRKFLGTLEAFTDLASTTVIFDGVHRGEPEERRYALLDGPAPARARLAQFATTRMRRRIERRKARYDRAQALVHAQPRQILDRLTGLDLSYRRAGDRGRTVKDDRHVE